MTEKPIVAGVGMTKFVKPGTSELYHKMGANAVRMALEDAGLDYKDIKQAYVGWVYGDSTSGQAALYEVGMTGIPVANVNNNCSTGSTALFLARQAVEHGIADCVLALGFEQMAPGALAAVFNDRPTPTEWIKEIADENFPGHEGVPGALRMFGSAGYEYQQKYDAPTELFAKVRVKAARHAEHNERAIFRKPLTVDEVLAGDKIFLNLTKLQCCPPTNGAAAAIICTPEFARKKGLDASVSIVAQAMTTDTEESKTNHTMIEAVGFHMTRSGANSVYETAGIGPEDVDVVELHDCFAPNEVITYEGLGLCPVGGAVKFVEDGDNTYGGQVVTNPSGGLLSKGHPLGATGLAQCFELTSQLKGRCGPRQVEDARFALQHNLGLGGACVVTMYGRN